MRRDASVFASLDNPNTLSREIALFAIWGIKQLRETFGCYFAMET